MNKKTLKRTVFITVLLVFILSVEAFGQDLQGKTYGYGDADFVAIQKVLALNGFFVYINLNIKPDTLVYKNSVGSVIKLHIGRLYTNRYSISISGSKGTKPLISQLLNL